MSNVKELVAHYLGRMQQGHAQEAFFGLIEADPAVLPLLMAAFAKAENRGIRAQIVECIWQRRCPETIGFLSEALMDSERAVWREALDGLVAIGGSEAVRALQAARTKIPPSPARQGISVEWVNEALAQLQDRGTE